MGCVLPVGSAVTPVQGTEQSRGHFVAFPQVHGKLLVSAYEEIHAAVDSGVFH